MSVELASYYVSIIPSARGIEKNIARELQPIEGVAALQGQKAGTALGGGLASKFATKTGGLLQGLDRQLGNFGGPFTGRLTTIGTSLRTVESGELRAAAGASELERVGTAAYLGIGLAAAGFGAISIKSALGAEQAHAQLEQAIEKTKGSYDDYGDSIDSTVGKLAKFGFDQEEVEASLAKLTRASKDPAKALDLIGIAADVARAKNLDLGSASQILVNIEAGRVRGLAQLGISTKDANGKTVTSEEALRRITALYGGAAAANAKTYAGELQAVGAEAHNLEERIGGDVLPVVADLGKDLLVGVGALEAANHATDGWLGTLGEIVLIGGGVAVAVSKIGGGVSHLTDLLTANRAAAEAASGAQALDATGVISTGAAAPDAVADAQLTIARAKLAEATVAATEAQANFDAALLAGAGAEEADLTAAVTLTEADHALAAAKVELASATAAADAAQVGAAATAEGATVAAGFLGTGLSAAGAAGLIGAAGIGSFIATTKILNAVAGTTKPNVDDLTSSLLLLEKTGSETTSGIDFEKLGRDITRDQESFGKKINVPKTLIAPLTLPFTTQKFRQARKDIEAENDALTGILKTDGVDAATRAYGFLTTGLKEQGLTTRQVGTEFEPFNSALRLARVREDELTGTTGDASQSFSELAKGLEKNSALLGIADQLDTAKQAVEDLQQLKLDAVGQGQKSIDAARNEEQAQQSLSDAYRSQQSAATSLADAKSKLAQFDSPTDTRIRSLELQQIQGRVVTTPEEARQKEIDLLKFGEDNANKRADLQAQIVTAENGVQSATEGVQKAQEGVSAASEARRKVQTDAAAAIAGGERKAQEAILATAKAIADADAAGQFSKGNQQLAIYVGLLDGLSHTLDPNSPLTKNLDKFLANVAKPVGPKALGAFPGPADFLKSLPAGAGTTTTTTQPPTAPHIDASQHVVIHGNADRTSLSELDLLNKKQAIRLRVGLR